MKTLRFNLIIITIILILNTLTIKAETGLHFISQRLTGVSSLKWHIKKYPANEFAINDYYISQKEQQKSDLNSPNSHSWVDVSVMGGIGYWFGANTALSLRNTELNDLKKGLTYGVNLKLYFHENVGIAIKYNSFNTRRKLDAKILDKINLTFIGGGLAFRNFINDGKLVFYSTFVLGKVFFKNSAASYANYKEITTSSLGYNISCGLDFKIYKRIFWGISTSMLYGSSMKIKYDNVEYYTLEPIFYSRLDVVCSLKILL